MHSDVILTVSDTSSESSRKAATYLSTYVGAKTHESQRTFMEVRRREVRRGEKHLRIEHLSNIYRTSIEHPMNIQWTSIQHPTDIQQTSNEAVTKTGSGARGTYVCCGAVVADHGPPYAFLQWYVCTYVGLLHAVLHLQFRYVDFGYNFDRFSIEFQCRKSKGSKDRPKSTTRT